MIKCYTCKYVKQIVTKGGESYFVCNHKINKGKWIGEIRECKVYRKG